MRIKGERTHHLKIAGTYSGETDHRNTQPQPAQSQMFGIFSALEHLMERECENLSGGEMQMVSISRLR